MSSNVDAVSVRLRRALDLVNMPLSSSALILAFFLIWLCVCFFFFCLSFLKLLKNWEMNWKKLQLFFFRLKKRQTGAYFSHWQERLWEVARGNSLALTIHLYIPTQKIPFRVALYLVKYLEIGKTERNGAVLGRHIQKPNHLRQYMHSLAQNCANNNESKKIKNIHGIHNTIRKNAIYFVTRHCLLVSLKHLLPFCIDIRLT